MIKLSLEKIAEVVNGKLVNSSAAKTIAAVAIDSNKVTPGALFVAIEGARQDGHSFIEEAFANGATVALVSKPIADFPHILVTEKSQAPEDFSQPTIWALAKLAKYVHQNLPQLITVAITGSSGKTTTKDLVLQLGDLLGSTIATKGSANNEIGMPLTVLECNDDTRLLVLEMGARHSGNIAYLTNIAKPNFSIITHIGTAHLEIFGSQENIVNTKAEIIENLSAADWAIINLDDDNSKKVINKTLASLATFAVNNDADLIAKSIKTNNHGNPRFELEFKGQSSEVKLNLVGNHNVYNAMAAALPFLLSGVSLEKVAARLNSSKALSNWRMESTQLKSNILLINDAYNANFESMSAALQALAQIGNQRRKIAILGEMKELGEQSQSFHFAIGELTAKMKIDHLLVVGGGAKKIIDGARADESWSGEATLHENNQTLFNHAKELLNENDVVLIKASRSVGLEVLAKELIEIKGEA
jgi:UDP-N-acetylmuramoyl-tripeptide--D-alanyl-D-alanine ligase